MTFVLRGGVVDRPRMESGGGGTVPPARLLAEAQRRLVRLRDLFEFREGGLAPLFETLALDFALTRTNEKTGELHGDQECLCRPFSDQTAGRNWYRNALRRYFRQAGSLLAHPGVVDFAQRQRWSMLVAQAPRSPRGSRPPRGRLATSPVVWRQPFRTRPDRRNTHTVEDQFRLFSSAVARELSRVASPAAVSRVAVLWIYVGPEVLASVKHDATPEWGVSLFLTFRMRFARGRWFDREESPETMTLLSAVERLHADLALHGHVDARRRDDLERITRQRMAQTIAHEFKHWSQEPVLAATNLQLSLRRGATTAEIAPAVQHIVALTKLLNSISIGMHRLLVADPGEGFHAARDAVMIVRAAARVAIELLASTRKHWQVVDSLSHATAMTQLARRYAAGSADRLLALPSMAVLMFVVTEACRNVRARRRDGEEARLEIWTDIGPEVNVVSIHQRTSDDHPEAVWSSQSLDFINDVLRRAGSFCEIDSFVAPVDVDGDFRARRQTHRITEIKVHRIPA